MNFKKLLIATSMLALVSSQASAVTLTKFDNAGIALGAGVAPDVNVSVAALKPALEAANPAAALTGEYEIHLALDSGTAFTVGQDIDIKIDLPAGYTFKTVSSADVTDGLGGTQVSGSLPSGVAGGTTATWRAQANGAGQAIMKFTLNLATTECPTKAGAATGSLSATASFTDGTPVEGTGPALLAMADVISGVCTSGFNGGAATDVVADNTQIGTTGVFTTLINTNHVGTLDLSFDNTVELQHPTTFALIPVAAADVASVTFDVVLGNDDAFTQADAGAVNLQINGGAASLIVGVQDDATNTWSFTVTGADIVDLYDGTPDDIEVTLDNKVSPTNTIASSSVTYTNSVVTFATPHTPAFIVSEAAGKTTVLDALDRVGASFGPFDWNAETGAVNSVYRITGLPTTGDVTYSIALDNSKGGKDGYYSGTIPASAITNGEVSVNSRKMFGLGNGATWDTSGDAANMAGYNLGDVTLVLDVDNTSSTVDVDRLIASKGGIVSNYGDGANVASGQGTSNDYDDNNVE